MLIFCLCERAAFKTCRWKGRKWAIFLSLEFPKNIWKNMSNNVIQTGYKFFYPNMKSTFFAKWYLMGVKRSDLFRCRLYPLTYSNDYSNVLPNLIEFSLWSWYCANQLSSKIGNYSFLSFTTEIHSQKFHLLFVRNGRLQNEINESDRIVHINWETIER